MTDWDDLRVIHAVAEAGSLSAAARRLGLSQPTIGRRVQALEERLGLILFERSADGYRPTAAGGALLPHLRAMAESAAALEREARIQGDSGTGLVRVAAGGWASRFLAERLARLREALPGIDLALDFERQMPDLAGDSVHLGVYAAVPDLPGLRSRLVARSAYAVYGARAYVDRHPEAWAEARIGVCDWVIYDSDRVRVGSDVDGYPLDRQLALAGNTRILRLTTTDLMLSVLLSGAGLALIPCFVGDAHPDLVRVSPIVPAMEHRYRLIVHQDVGRSPRVARAKEAIAALFAAERRLLEGEAGAADRAGAAVLA
ncbi:LysR family transcriptional regulator [Inquilinus sp. CA228]|uniref:LysR family transcriptional regulator n=1 Tax=Inquilinus sp. CA228 TaxID=3455609 RepID=UPI003F8D5A98